MAKLKGRVCDICGNKIKSGVSYRLSAPFGVRLCKVIEDQWDSSAREYDVCDRCMKAIIFEVKRKWNAQDTSEQ